MFSSIVLCERMLLRSRFSLDTIRELVHYKTNNELLGYYLEFAIVPGIQLNRKSDDKNLCYLRAVYYQYLLKIKNLTTELKMSEMTDSPIYDSMVFSYVNNVFGSLDVKFSLIKKNLVSVIVRFLSEIEDCYYDPDHILVNYGTMLFSLQNLSSMLQCCDSDLTVEDGLRVQWNLLEDSSSRRGFIHFLVSLLNDSSLLESHNSNESFISFFAEYSEISDYF